MIKDHWRDQGWIVYGIGITNVDQMKPHLLLIVPNLRINSWTFRKTFLGEVGLSLLLYTEQIETTY